MNTQCLFKGKILPIAAITFLLVSMLSAGIVFEVQAATLDITVDDWGIHAVPVFANVTFTNDSTGTDWWDSGGSGSAFAGVSQNSINSIPLSFGVGVDGYTIDGFSSSIGGGASISGDKTTNQTSEEAVTGFEEYTYQTGDYDFKKLEDEDTNVWDKNTSAAANLFNVTASYAKLNKTLTEAEEDTDFDNQDFRSGITDMRNAYTFAVGYADLREGLGEDLKNVLSIVTGVDASKFRILEWNLTSFHITYNTTEDWVKKVKGWVDEALDYEASQAAMLYHSGLSYYTGSGRLMSIGSINSLKATQAFSATTFIKDLGSNLRSASISFGTGLKQATSRTISWIKGGIEGGTGTVTKAASDLWRTAGGLAKSAISGGQKLAVDLSHKVGTGVNTVLSKGVSIFGSAVASVFKILGSPLLWILIAIVLIFAIIFGPRIVRAAQRKL
jgi:hypothetical protein